MSSFVLLTFVSSKYFSFFLGGGGGGGFLEQQKEKKKKKREKEKVSSGLIDWHRGCTFDGEIEIYQCDSLVVIVFSCILNAPSVTHLDYHDGV